MKRFYIRSGENLNDVTDVVGSKTIGYNSNELSSGLSEKNEIGSIIEVGSGYRYIALLNQTGTDAPIATILENNIGDVVWSYTDIGRYTGTLVNGFSYSVSIFVGNKFTLNTNHTWAYCTNTTDSIDLTIQDDTGFVDGELTNTLLEVRLYPSIPLVEF